MKDMFENTILCKNCGTETERCISQKDGFRIRTLICPKCNDKWLHPLDLKEYQDFTKLRNKNFNVKLRIVGNSFCVSIPKEIIEFADLEKELNKMINIVLEKPGKLSLFFRKEIFIKD